MVMVNEGMILEARPDQLLAGQWREKITIIKMAEQKEDFSYKTPFISYFGEFWNFIIKPLFVPFFHEFHLCELVEIL